MRLSDVKMSKKLTVFFLLVGRYLEHRTRAGARTAAAELSALAGRQALVRGADGTTHLVRVEDLEPGQVVAASSSLVFAFGIGAAAGPTLAAGAMRVRPRTICRFRSSPETCRIPEAESTNAFPASSKTEKFHSHLKTRSLSLIPPSHSET